MMLCRVPGQVRGLPDSEDEVKESSMALTNLSPSALSLTRVALVLSAASDIFILTTPYYPNNRPPGDTPYYVAASIAYHGAWLLYLWRSVRVRNTLSSG